jgi:hypothetical protein
MPEFIVSSGDFEVRIKRRSARRAAKDAIGLLKDSRENIHLGYFVGVCGVSDNKDMIYLSTIVLMEENGIKFKLVGDECEDYCAEETY